MLSRSAPYLLFGLLPLSLAACSADPEELPPAPPVVLLNDCPGVPYLARASLNSDWYWRQTIVGTELLVEGTGQLQRVQLRENDRLELVLEDRVLQSWPITRRLDLQCIKGQATEVIENDDGAYLEVDWSSQTGSRALQGGSFEAQSVAQIETVVGPEWIELTENGAFTLEPGVCAQLNQGFGSDIACMSTAQLRHSLVPVDDNYSPYTDDSAFLYYTKGTFAARAAEVPALYLPPQAPPVLVQAAEHLQAELTEAFGSFEVKENDCNEANIEATLAANPNFSAVGGITLIERCQTLERLLPDQFTWQKPGSLRAFTIQWSQQSASNSWGTFAARASASESGRILAGDLFVNATRLEEIRATVESRASDPLLAPLVSLASERAVSIEQVETSWQHTSPTDPPDRSLASIQRLQESLFGAPEGALAEHQGYATLLAGPSSDQGLPIEFRVFRFLNARIEHMLDLSGRAAAAELMHEGYSFLKRWEHDAFGASGELLAMAPEDAAKLVHERVAQHRLLHGTLELLGLSDNPAGSWDEASTVLDTVPSEHQHTATSLGPYDLAALRRLYQDGPTADELLRCSIAQAMSSPTLACAIDDRGQTARASLAHAYERWIGHYPITHILEDPNDAFDARAAVRPALDVFWRASIAAQQLDLRTRTEPSFPGSSSARDLSVAVLHAVNFAAEVLSLPQAGRYCPWPGATPKAFLPASFLDERSCDSTLPVDSEEAAAQEQIEVPLGRGRDRIVGRSAEGEPWTRVGSSADKSNVLWSLITAFPTETTQDSRSVSILDIAPQAVQLYQRILSEYDPFFIKQQMIQSLGGPWCDGLQSSALIDPQTGEAPSPSTSDCALEGFVYPSLSINELSNAVFYTQAMNAGPSMRFYEVGVDDGMIDWDSIPPAEFCTFLNPSDSEFRALRTENPAACGMLEHAANIQSDLKANPSNRVLRDVYLAWNDLIQGAHALSNLSE